MNPDLKDARILIVDDQVPNVEILEAFLDMQGYTQVYSTTDSRQVSEIVDQFKPDLLLLDLMMPHVSGFDVMTQLKQRGSLTRHLPVLVLTADATTETKQKALSGGASDFLTKPFDLVEVGLRIKNLLYSAYLLAELRSQNDTLEERVKERTSALEKQNETLRDIAWTQSHVVRAPLARMMGVVALMELEQPTDAEFEELMSIILSSAHELDAIITDISHKTYASKLF
jgi:DNA-binding response OmpR family regulator